MLYWNPEMVRRFLIKVLVCAVAMYVASSLITGFTVLGGLQGYLIAGLVLGFLNTFIRPILKLLAFPLILISLGFFTFIINAGILWFVGRATDQVVISGLWPLIWATLVVSVVTMIVEPRSKHIKRL